MLAITKKTGYGLIALTHLAKLNKESLASAREIAEVYNIPQSLLMNVLKELAAAGFIESVRGARGGYRLLKTPGEIDFVSLMETLEGPMKLAECVTNDMTGESTCKLIDNCPIFDPVHKVHRKMRDFLKHVTLEEVLQSNDVPDNCELGCDETDCSASSEDK